MTRRKLIVINAILLLLILLPSLIYPCTTAIISGKFTKDGRPLLFKHRDTGTLDNKLMFFSDGKYEYIGVVNSPDLEGKEVWAGVNSAGFAIMNSASYNLNLNDTTTIKDQEGVVMKLALQQCATIEDFETLLGTLIKPLGVEANFGVIDANGGAAYYETGNFDFTKYDVNDQTIAPFGYIIRTNHSFTRDAEKGYGYIRFQNANELFNIASATNEFSHEFILQKVSRSLRHSLTKVDLMRNLPIESGTPCFVDFRDFIPRFSSAATTVVQGVKPGESPEFTTMWTILGFQLCSVAIPTWVAGGEQMPGLLMVNEKGSAPLCDMALKLKKECFPIERGSGKYYMNLSAVVNQEETGILQQLFPVEEKIFELTDSYMSLWRGSKMDKREIQKFYKLINGFVLKTYKAKFGFKI
ncbi:hypothetical protein B6I21_06765 [candidate division KSB1 bacterium 4572_119]|nr:MAG: hypothetical protein B6I21_06765 [candidate division KSB1 bacterium 4572_119]